ncbi:MAG TPA: hypothetical protein VKU41_31810 [Polyangiaceae bacterium]|nr:hypothetical protein [Polyangiaceae bacterium]
MLAGKGCDMSPIHLATVVLALGALGACSNVERAKECDQLMSTIKPLDEGMPSADIVDRVHEQLNVAKFEDQPLGIFAKNYADRLAVLSGTLRLASQENPPDGTDLVIKAKLKEARTDSVDIGRYCAQ